jgi:predicted GIY-YIG superfamily endonuclease
MLGQPSASATGAINVDLAASSALPRVVGAGGSFPSRPARAARLFSVRGERRAAGAAVLAAAASGSPAEPGVYLFLGEADEVLYVGKATNLQSRLRQHANVGPPTSHLHLRYELVRRVVWDVSENEKAAAWREADLIFAIQPPFNADPGLRSRDPLGGAARSPFLVVTEGRDATLRFALEPDPSTAGAVYGCFPHLGKGVASQLGIACSDGYVALLRLLWAASGDGANFPTSITRSAPTTFEVRVAEELRGGLHRLLSGVSAKVVDALASAAGSRPAFMQPALARDREASLQFFAAAPQLVRARRLHHAIKAPPVTADLYAQLVIDEIISAVGHVERPSAGTARPS